MLLTWLFHAHEDSFSRKWEKGKHVLKDCVALERVSREEDGEEICLGPNAQDIPVHDFVQADVQFQVVKDKAVNSWKRAGCETFHQDLAPQELPSHCPFPGAGTSQFLPGICGEPPAGHLLCITLEA